MRVLNMQGDSLQLLLSTRNRICEVTALVLGIKPTGNLNNLKYASTMLTRYIAVAAKIEVPGRGI